MINTGLFTTNRSWVIPDEIKYNKQTNTEMNTKYKIRDNETKKIFYWTLTEVLEEINRDHSDGWSDYDESDWQEGWEVWVEGAGYLSML